jgi:hypothetical protein
MHSRPVAEVSQEAILVPLAEDADGVFGVRRQDFGANHDEAQLDQADNEQRPQCTGDRAHQ